jgi:hypothetical protein
MDISRIRIRRSPQASGRIYGFRTGNRYGVHVETGKSLSIPETIFILDYLFLYNGFCDR